MCALRFIEVREKNDIDTVVLLADAIWREHYDGIISDGQIDYMLQNYQSYAAIKRALDDGYKYRIIEFDGVPVGYYAVVKRDKKLYLDKLYVLREKRGQQVGGNAVKHIIEYAVSQNCKLIYLTVNKYNTASIRAYRSYGFKTESALVTDIGGGYVMDDYQMYLYL